MCGSSIFTNFIKWHTQSSTLVHVIIRCYFYLPCEMNEMTFQFSDAISGNWLFVVLGVDWRFSVYVCVCSFFAHRALITPSLIITEII